MGISRATPTTILLDRPGQALGLTAGDRLVLEDGSRRTVSALPASLGPYFRAELDRGVACEEGPVRFKREHIGGVLAGLLRTCGIVLGLGIGFFVFGGAIVARSRAFGRYPPRLRAGAAVFLGGCLFLTAWRLLEALLCSARAAALVAMVLAAALVVLQRLRGRGRPALQAGFVPKLALLYVVGLCFVGSLWLAHDPANLYVASGSGAIGAFESNRYANIASFVGAADRIPVLKQNYGQSLLAALPGFFGRPQPHLSLLAWLAFWLAAVLLLVDGWAQWLGASRPARLLTFALLLFGGPRLTLIMTQVTDNHSSPLAYNGYADTLIGLGGATCLLLLAAHELRVTRTAWRHRLVAASVAASFASVLPLVGFHMWVTSMCVACAAVLTTLRRQAWPDAASAAWVIFGMVAGALATASLGGMLTPDRYLSTDLIPGLMQAPSTEKTRLKFLLDSNLVCFFDPRNWIYYSPSKELHFRRQNWSDVWHVSENVFVIENVLWDVVRSGFFPLLSLLCAGGWLRGEVPSVDVRSSRKFLLVSVLASGAVGLLFAVFLSVNQVRRELLRFLNQAYFYGMVLCAQVFSPAGPSPAVPRRLWPTVLVATASCAGPLVAILLQVSGAYGRLDVAQKINFVVKAPVFSDGYHPSRQQRCRKLGAKGARSLVVCEPPPK